MKVVTQIYLFLSLTHIACSHEFRVEVSPVLESSIEGRFSSSLEAFDDSDALEELYFSILLQNEIQQSKPSKTSSLRREAKSGARKLKRSLIGPVRIEKGLLAAWLKDAEDEKSRIADLEASAQALLLFLELDLAGEAVASDKELHGLANFIGFLQRADGIFEKGYYPGGGGRPFDPFRLASGPGQACAALLMLFEKENDARWLRIARKGLLGLAKARIQLNVAPKDYWALLATEKLLTVEKELDEAERDVLFKHTELICNALMEDQIRNNGRPGYLGTFEFYGITDDNSTALQGLWAALSILPQDHEMRPQIKKAIEIGTQFLITCQVKEGKNKGWFPYALRKVNPAIPDSEGFNKHAEDVSIKYTANAVIALTRYAESKKKVVPQKE